MKEELRPCVVKIGEETQTIQFVNSEPITRILKEGEVHKGYFHMWYKEERTEQSAYTLMDGGIKTQLLAVVEFEDGTVHMVEPECITFTDRQNVTVNREPENAMIVEGDICEFGKNEKVYMCVTLGRGSMTDDRYVEGFYLTGGNIGHIGRFKLKELRKTDKHINIENFLNQR